MSRFDKYNGHVGGFRAPLAAATVTGANSDKGKVWAVGLDGSGQVVKGAGATGVVGVICPVRDMTAGEMIDVMTSGEIADFTLQDGSAAGAGTRYYGAAAAGAIDETATGTPLGWTVEASRLVVRVDRATTPTT